MGRQPEEAWPDNPCRFSPSNQLRTLHRHLAFSPALASTLTLRVFPPAFLTLKQLLLAPFPVSALSPRLCLFSFISYMSLCFSMCPLVSLCPCVCPSIPISLAICLFHSCLLRLLPFPGLCNPPHPRWKPSGV